VGSIATVFWGGMLGGWFGIEDIHPWIGFTPMSEPLKMMGLCLGLGMFQIVVGMFTAIYIKIRRGRPLDAFLDHGLWLVLFVGIGLLFVNKILGYVFIGIGAGGVLFTAGRSKKGLFGKFAGGFGALYNITGYISDILSYARLFGMGLATGVIAMVFNKVAMMIWGGVVGTTIAIVILVVGHVFNLGINTLGAYVHACRLQYIEFFGKFYEGGGVLFKPLDATGKYMDFADGDKVAS
jgi:V/A-type H+-transporting ATPase subunit I